MREKGLAFFVVILAVVMAAVFILVVFSFLRPSDNIQPLNLQNQKTKPTEQTQSKWQEKGVVIAGQYADAEVIDLGNNQYRMYYSVEPEVPGNNLEVYSAVSSDGISWKKESGVRKTFATFPDIVKVSDGRWRMYFQNAGVIKSAISSDGLSWTDEPGVRIVADEPGFDIADVGAQGTIKLDDGTFVTVYRGTINKPYQAAEKLPNKDIHIYFWATSKDGLQFEKKGLAIDSRNDVLLGAADGAEWVRWSNEELRVYIWSYAGVFYVTYKDGTFFEPVFDFTSNKDPMAKFPPNPPADPTLAKINGKWFMYYGQHTKGIYYATEK